MRKTSLALCAIAFTALFFAGCGKEPEKATAVDKSAYKEQLQVKDMKRADLRRARSMLETKMREKIEEARAKFSAEEKKLSKADFTAFLKKELEKDPEWNSLYKRCEDAAEALEDNRRATLDVIRERMLSEQGKSISK